MVWLLIAISGGTYSWGVVTPIKEYTSQEECIAVAKAAHKQKSFLGAEWQCIQLTYKEAMK